MRPTPIRPAAVQPAARPEAEKQGPTAPGHATPSERAAGPTGAGQGGRTPAAAQPTSAVPAVQGGRVNINTATAKELELLPRIGPALAQRIIEDRTRNGAYKTIEDLNRVKGIGPKTLERLRPLVILESAGAAKK